MTGSISAAVVARSVRLPLLLAAALVAGGLFRLISERAPTELAWWAVSGIPRDGLRFLGVLEILLGAALLLHSSRRIALALAILWSFAVSLASASLPGRWLEYLLPAAAPLADPAWPGAVQVFGWVLVLLSLHAWRRTEGRFWSPSAALWLVLPQELPAAAEPTQDPGLDVIAFASCDPRLRTWDDLAELGPVFRDVDLVVLGETHRDGAAYALKTRLVRYLHEAHGFDVLAFESPLLECEALNERLDEVASAEELGAGGIAPIWGASPYMLPLFQYLLDVRAGERPIRIVGLDCKFRPPATDGQTTPSMPDDVTSYLRQVFGNPREGEVAEALSEVAEFVRAVDSGQTSTWYDSRPLVRASIARLEDRSRASMDPEAASVRLGLSPGALARVLAGLATFEDWNARIVDALTGLDGSYTNPRDAYMANTLEWYLGGACRGRKAIVWTGGLHGIADPGAVTYPKVAPGVPGRFDRLCSLAQRCRERFGQRAYVIGTTSLRGMYGTLNVPRHLTDPQPGSLEEELWRGGALAGFVDARSQAGRLSRPRYARISDDLGALFELPRALDGVLFARSAWSDRPWPVEKIIDTWPQPQVAGLPDEVARSLSREMSERLRNVMGVSQEARHEFEAMLRWAVETPLASWPRGDPGHALATRPVSTRARTFEWTPIVPVHEIESVLVFLERGCARPAAFEFERPSILLAGAGPLEGEIRFRTEGVLATAGDVAGLVECGGAVRLEAAGSLVGTVKVVGGGDLRFRRGLAPSGRVRFAAPGARIALGGFTAVAALDAIQGPAQVHLETSDLEPGRHAIGSLDVLVGIESKGDR